MLCLRSGKTHAVAPFRSGTLIRLHPVILAQFWGENCESVNPVQDRSVQPPRHCDLRQLDPADLLICDELGYLSFGRAGAELLDCLAHHCHIFEMNGESHRFRESVKKSK